MSDAEDELFDKEKWGEKLFSGSIEKRGVSAIKNWKTRHVELYETRLVYYTKKVSPDAIKILKNLPKPYKNTHNTSRNCIS